MNSLLASLRAARDSAFLLLVAGVVAGSCGDPTSSPTLGTNSNWLVVCTDDGDCTGAARCECARCTRGCDADAACGAIEGGRCALASTPAVLSQCGAETPLAGLCLLGCSPGDCAETEACVSGACVTGLLPDNDFCSPVAASTRELRAGEDELFELVQALRAAGGVACGTNAPSSPASVAVRADGRLRCAARVLATDIDAQGTRGLTDSNGRDSRERLQAAGYAATFWAEGYAVAARTASDALAVMLADDAACSGLTRDGYAALGVAHVGTAYVVTLGAD
jgi:hypothetical protein